LLETRVERRKQLSRKILIASERERKKAQKSNTSKGTMTVELNGTKSFLQLKVILLFVCVLKVAVVLFHFAFKRGVLKAEL